MQSWAQRWGQEDSRGLENQRLDLGIRPDGSESERTRLTKPEIEMDHVNAFSVLGMETSILCLGQDSSQCIKCSTRRESCVKTYLQSLKYSNCSGSLCEFGSGLLTYGRSGIGVSQEVVKA